jgi:hypothetical protein
MPTTSRKARKSTTTRKESTMAPSFPTDPAALALALESLGATYDAGKLRVTFTADEDEAILSSYGEGHEDGTTLYADSDAAEALALGVREQAVAMFTDPQVYFHDLGLSRTALALCCWRWAEGWRRGVTEAHIKAVKADRAAARKARAPTLSGFEVHHTGGNCTALVREVETAGRAPWSFVVVTDEAGGSKDFSADDFTIGVYWDEAWMPENGRMWSSADSDTFAPAMAEALAYLAAGRPVGSPVSRPFRKGERVSTLAGKVGTVLKGGATTVTVALDGHDLVSPTAFPADTLRRVEVSE